MLLPNRRFFTRVIGWFAIWQSVLIAEFLCLTSTDVV